MNTVVQKLSIETQVFKRSNVGNYSERQFLSPVQVSRNALSFLSGYKLSNIAELIIYHKSYIRFLHFGFQGEEIYWHFAPHVFKMLEYLLKSDDVDPYFLSLSYNPLKTVFYEILNFKR